MYKSYFWCLLATNSTYVHLWHLVMPTILHRQNILQKFGSLWNKIHRTIWSGWSILGFMYLTKEFYRIFSAVRKPILSMKGKASASSTQSINVISWPSKNSKAEYIYIEWINRQKNVYIYLITSFVYNISYPLKKKGDYRVILCNLHQFGRSCESHHKTRFLCGDLLNQPAVDTSVVIPLFLLSSTLR